MRQYCTNNGWTQRYPANCLHHVQAWALRSASFLSSSFKFLLLLNRVEIVLKPLVRRHAIVFVGLDWYFYVTSTNEDKIAPASLPRDNCNNNFRQTLTSFFDVVCSTSRGAILLKHKKSSPYNNHILYRLQMFSQPLRIFTVPSR